MNKPIQAAQPDYHCLKKTVRKAHHGRFGHTLGTPAQQKKPAADLAWPDVMCCITRKALRPRQAGFHRFIVWTIFLQLDFKEHTMTTQLRILSLPPLMHPVARLDAAQQEAA